MNSNPSLRVLIMLFLSVIIMAIFMVISFSVMFDLGIIYGFLAIIFTIISPFLIIIIMSYIFEKYDALVANSELNDGSRGNQE